MKEETITALLSGKREIGLQKGLLQFTQQQWDQNIKLKLQEMGEPNTGLAPNFTNDVVTQEDAAVTFHLEAMEYFAENVDGNYLQAYPLMLNSIGVQTGIKAGMSREEIVEILINDSKNALFVVQTLDFLLPAVRGYVYDVFFTQEEKLRVRMEIASRSQDLIIQAWNNPDFLKSLGVTIVG